MAQTDWDRAYDNRGHIAESDSLIKRLPGLSAEFRASVESELDISYGDGERERFDLFFPQGTSRGLAVFIHGGYWRSFSKSDWSRYALGAVQRGWTVAVPSYDLAPDVRISHMTQQISKAVRTAAERVAGPVHLCGHSAGAHLAARMICSDTNLPSDILQRLGPITCISGLFDLRPLMQTTINDDLRIDLDEAHKESPALLEPLRGKRVLCWVGGGELPEFIRQSALLANIWKGMGVSTRFVSFKDHHHFGIVDDLMDSDSDLMDVFVGDGWQTLQA